MDQPSQTLESFHSRSREETSPLDTQPQPYGLLTTETEFQTILLPGNPNRFGPSYPPLQTLDSDLEPRVLGKPWRPAEDRDRAHGWSEADRKHEMQARLLDVEEGVNYGFTERE